MYREHDSFLEDALMTDDLLFEYSPAESLINFELPSNSSSDTIDWQLSDLDIDCDAFISSVSERNKNDSTLEDCSPALFDFADLDKSINLEEYLLEAWTSDRSSDTTQSTTDSNDSSDEALGRLSVLGIDLESICQETSKCGDYAPESMSANWRTHKSAERETEKVNRRSWGEPAFCPDMGLFRCPVENCGKLYAKASHVRAHLRRHSGEKPYRCTWGECTWRFARSDELARHRRSHSGDKPYGCRECTKRFARSDHLAKHGRVHARRAAAAAAAAAAASAAAAAKRTVTSTHTLRNRRVL